ncbi:hypothetical protein BDZ94DRAFT_1254974 [Collybia nuda]|uniref:F-box domain-containing protein n=1 Tax=Collybia nuda TaxID=64659 RepID=A0A9P5YA66_9AGAR|nr:hypothetical protein BDZ94DRAFT_1254974 [Collybia nuda]
MAASTKLVASDLPIETWTHIIQFLQYSHQIPFLHVSRSFHAIAVRFVFASIRIYLVGKESSEFFAMSYGPPLPSDEILERSMQRSWEILQHIKDNPEFASVVKTIIVVAMADSHSIFEKLCLIQALQAIPRLRSFYWFGRSPELSEGLTASLPPSLRNLSLETVPSPTMLQHLNQITHLRLVHPFYYARNTHDIVHDDHWSEELADSESTVVIVKSMAVTLKELSLVARNVSEMPIRMYSALTTLDICATFNSDVASMELVFRHAPLLECLSLVGHISVDIFSILPNDSTSLPYLRSFRLSCEEVALPVISHEAIRVLSVFLEGRSLLRRLFVRLAGASWYTLSDLLPTIESLVNLEVLGFHAGYRYLEWEDFNQLASLFSSKLKAVHIAIPWNHQDSATIDVNALWPLLFYLGKLPRLTFLHLYGIGRYLPIVPEDLVNEVQHLETVGLNRVLWDVDKSQAEVKLTEWPPWRLKFSVEEDFACPDDAWLMTYH